MIRVAAVGDLHVAEDTSRDWRQMLEPVSHQADVLLLAGDLTRVGTLREADAVAFALGGVSIPIVAVLGNHDFHSDRVGDVRRILEKANVQVLEGEGAVLSVGGVRLGVAGAKGFGGGFENACGSEFGEPEMRAFVAHTRSSAERLRGALEGLAADARVALLHYSPVTATLRGEREQIYPFLGSHLLAEAVDLAGADLVLHGHAHAGSERGATPGGIAVRNVAQPVIHSAYRVFCFSRGARVACDDSAI